MLLNPKYDNSELKLRLHGRVKFELHLLLGFREISIVRTIDSIIFKGAVKISEHDAVRQPTNTTNGKATFS